jgi:hypothetical protein
MRDDLIDPDGQGSAEATRCPGLAFMTLDTAFLGHDGREYVG